ncbi:MAG: DUF72 domain-containing protein [Verrucomicrobia bacterium]|nr:DUF72 domain-containing protein [Verrucomicrobiota bacterium]
MPGKIFVGTSSWSDPGFIADWYPKTLPASERLPYYAEHFNLVELNSSFYGIPVQRMVKRWCEQTPSDFLFDVKLHRLLSRHSAMPNSLPTVLRAEAEIRNGKLVLDAKLEKMVALYFLEQIKPFLECGKMGALLLQLSPSFSPTEHQLAELDPLLEVLSSHRVAVELRNRKWLDDGQAADTTRYFKERRISFVAVDAPESEHFMVMPRLDLVTNPTLAYMRLHGRNTRGFIAGKTVAERFDYQYSEEELQEIAARAAAMAGEAEETHVLYNNNSSDYALKSAARFRTILEESYYEMATPRNPNARLAQRTFEFHSEEK